MKKIEFIENIKIIKTFKRVKTINLRVRDGKVEILCPFFTLKSSIKNLIKEKKEWIDLNLNKSRKIEREKYYFREDNLMFKGNYLKLIYKKTNKQSIFLKKRILEINSNIREKDKKKKLVLNWLKSYSKNFLIKRIDLISRRIGIKYSSINIKEYRARWGCCNIRGDIFLNWKLIMLPVFVIDYVIIHELAHVVFPNHSKDFWNLVKKKDPKFNFKEEWLKKHGLAFISFN